LLARWWVTARRSAISMRRTVGVFVIKSLTVYGLPIRRTAARAVQPVVLPGLADGPWEVRRVVGASSPRLSGQSNQSKLPMQGTRGRHRCRARTPVARPDGFSFRHHDPDFTGQCPRLPGGLALDVLQRE
jgi:hypothetical protein